MMKLEDGDDEVDASVFVMRMKKKIFVLCELCVRIWEMEMDMSTLRLSHNFNI